eukprot:1292339-Karenia_brevis.AAC.1
MEWTSRKVPEVKYMSTDKATKSCRSNAANSRAKRPRLLPPLVVHWNHLKSTQVWVAGDNDLVIGWLTGKKRAQYKPYRLIVHALHCMVAALHASNCLQPADEYSEVWNHIYREHNEDADTLAKAGHGIPLEVTIWPQRCKYLRAQFDGSNFDGGSFAFGFLIRGTSHVPDKHIEHNQWQTLCEGKGRAKARSVVQAELIACSVVSVLCCGMAMNRDLRNMCDRLASSDIDICSLSMWLQSCTDLLCS